MNKMIFLLSIVFFILSFPRDCKAQDTIRPYLNAGYITSIIQPDDCTRPDAGGSIRIGILTKGKLGFYVGYSGFKEYHKDYIEYEPFQCIYRMAAICPQPFQHRCWIYPLNVSTNIKMVNYIQSIPIPP